MPVRRGSSELVEPAEDTTGNIARPEPVDPRDVSTDVSANTDTERDPT